jgi:hypothetical protein
VEAVLRLALSHETQERGVAVGVVMVEAVGYDVLQAGARAVFFGVE